MNPASCLKRRPSDEQWTAHLPRICELYYGLRYTLEDTQRIIQQETGFYATLRMYKDRIRNMAVHPKKICMQKYQAMNVVAEDFLHQGIPVHFIGPSGLQFFKRTPAEITKQLRRPHCLPLITLEQAKDVLRQSSIQAIFGNTTSISTSGNRRHNSRTSALSQHVADSSRSLDSQQPRSFASHQHNIVLSTPPTSHHHASQTPTGNHPVGVANVGPEPGIPGQPALVHRWSTLATPPGTRPDSLSLAGVNLLPGRLQKSRSTVVNVESYDFVADFDALTIPTPDALKLNQLATKSTNRTLPLPSSIQRRQLAIEIAAPFYLAGFTTTHVNDEFMFFRRRAMEQFKYILTANPDNQYVLPVLNWMSTVLPANNKPDLLKDFVSACCHVLDTHGDDGFPLSIPFRYMLAFCNEDPAGQEYHGAHLAQGTRRLVQLYGSDHPNVLVNEYFRAWHLMMRPSCWAKAKSILEACLIKSERIMGPQDLITINCLAVLGRGCAENGLHAQAKAIFMDGLGRFGKPARSLEAYHLLILGRLAAEEESLGQLATATSMFQQVYEGRMRRLSAASVDTRAALNTYVRALHRGGQPNEALKVQQNYDQELELLRKRDRQANSLSHLCHLPLQSKTPFVRGLYAQIRYE